MRRAVLATLSIAMLGVVALTGCSGGTVDEEVEVDPKWTTITTPYVGYVYRTCDDKGSLIYMFGESMQILWDGSGCADVPNGEKVDPVWTPVTTPYTGKIYRTCDEGNLIYMFGESMQIEWNSTECAR